VLTCEGPEGATALKEEQLQFDPFKNFRDLDQLKVDLQAQAEAAKAKAKQAN